MADFYGRVSDERDVVGWPRERVRGGLAQHSRQLPRGFAPEEPRNLAEPSMSVGRPPKGTALCTSMVSGMSSDRVLMNVDLVMNPFGT